MDHALASRFYDLTRKIQEKFPGDGEADLNTILFIVGVQEVGKGFRKYSKDEKMHLMHVAICTVLEPFGFYRFVENDDDGWPHFEKVKSIPNLTVAEQEELLKEAVIQYFEVNKLLEF